MGTNPRSVFTFEHQPEGIARICVVGVGGGGGNAVNNMVREGLQHVEFVVINTDSQALQTSLASHRIQAGQQLTKGLGTGARPMVGAEAMEESIEEVEKMLRGFDMCFITAGMGGGTGTGGAPVVADICKRLGILTVAIVTKPFHCEGNKRMDMAVDGIEKLKENVDTLVLIPNERLLSLADDDTTMIQAFEMADAVLYDATRGIADLITCTGLINLDFADVRTTMEDGGTALMGTGTAQSQDKRAEQAALDAISSPLMDGMSIRGARNVLVNISSGRSLRIRDATAATELIRREAGDDVEVIFGTVIDESMGDEFKVTVIATGFQSPQEMAEAEAKRKGSSLAESAFDYKGEQNLKVLDIPAFERRGAARRRRPPAVTDDSGEQVPKRKLRELSAPAREGQARRRPDSDYSDRPAFLRKMMD